MTFDVSGSYSAPLYDKETDQISDLMQFLTVLQLLLMASFGDDLTHLSALDLSRTASVS